MALAGMGMVTFAALTFGKSGLYFWQRIPPLVGFGAIDIAMMPINAAAPQATGQPSTQPNVRNLSKRALCWLCIGILHGTVLALWYITFDQNRAGTVWQLEPMLYDVVFFCVPVFIVAVVMLQAHKDRRPTIMVWWCFTMACSMLSTFGDYTPYPELSTLGSGFTLLHLFLTTFGIYFVVMHIDKQAERCDVRRGYQLLVGAGFADLQPSVVRA